MQSVRVRRGHYATLQDVPQEGRTTRPRSRSLATILGSPVPPSTPPLSSLPQGQDHGRRRSQTVSSPNDQPDSRPPNMRRPPSKIQEHIMSTTRGTSFRRHLHPGDPHGSPLLSADGRRPRGEERDDVVSLHGSTENVMYHGDGRHMGRVGSVLSAHDEDDEHHEDDIVEHLDVIDPAIATVSTLTNAANAIVIPPLSWYSRKCTVVLPDLPRRKPTPGDAEKGQADEDGLDRHIEDVLSRKDQYRRIARGVWSFMKTPLGVIVSIYGFLVVFWGTGIVFFLAKFINFHNSNTQGFWVELCQQVETGLFTATSIGLIPFRVLDTWRVWKIWHYQRITIKRRRQAGLPDLYDNNDLPDPLYDENHVHVLTDKEQADLHYQQHKFMQSMTWYRPHGTSTHRAFPIDTALWICIMNDLNSFFQILLSACMWSMDRFERPAWTTATTLPAAFVAGILAGVLIWWGGKKTRRHEQVEQRLRAALAMERPPSDGARFGASQRALSGIPESGTATAESTPTLLNRIESPRSKDFVDTSENGTADLPMKMPSIYENEKAHSSEFGRVSSSYDRSRRVSAASSIGSVPIADQMTVPAAEDIHPQSRSQ